MSDTNGASALNHALAWITSAPHGDNCFVSDHYEGDPGNRCNCGKDAVEEAINDALIDLASPPSPAEGEVTDLAYRLQCHVKTLRLSGRNDALTEDMERAVLALSQRQAQEPAGWREALQFYADGNHFVRHDAHAWDTVSGEPTNFQEDEANTATVEDGTVAAMALAGTPLRDDEPPAQEQAAPAVPVQEAWEAAGGNPGIKATKQELLDALRMLDQVVEETAAPAVAAPAVPVEQLKGWHPLEEDNFERKRFDEAVRNYGGDVRWAIAKALALWAAVHPNGTFADQCNVMANEVAALCLAPAEASQGGGVDDTKRLDWLDATNAPFKMGWDVDAAPAGNVSIKSVVYLGRPLVSIREAIDAAMRSTKETGNAD